jgi:hypothetical protein
VRVIGSSSGNGGSFFFKVLASFYGMGFSG